MNYPVINTQYQDGIKEVFQLVYKSSGGYREVLDIEEPVGMDEVNITVDINKEYFNVDTVILGETQKISFVRENDPIAFDLVQSMYESHGIEASVVFKWMIYNNGTLEYDLLNEDYELNFNKYSLKRKRDSLVIDIEVRLNDAGHIVLVKEDVVLDLFDGQNIHNNLIDNPDTTEIFFKDLPDRKENFYYYGYDRQPLNYNDRIYSYWFNLSEGRRDLDGGDNFGGRNMIDIQFSIRNNMFTAKNNYSVLELEVSNLHMRISNNGVYKPCALVVYKNDTLLQTLKQSTQETFNNQTVAELEVVNENYVIRDINIGDRINVYVLFETNITAQTVILPLKTTTSYTLSLSVNNPLRKVRGVRLFDALEQIVKNISDGTVGLISPILNTGGTYYNTVIFTGAYIRKIGANFLGAEQFKTSFENVFYNGIAKLMALGFDVFDNNVHVMPLQWFFKKNVFYDLTDYDYIEEDTEEKNNAEIHYNTVEIGTSKTSTGGANDLMNYNTNIKAEIPIKRVKKKFEKKHDLIIDPSQINIEANDTSNYTKTTDDDIILIDCYENFINDDALFFNATHQAINQTELTISTIINIENSSIIAGSNIYITSGINIGLYLILQVSPYQFNIAKLGTQTLVSGTSDTGVTVVMNISLKSRANEDIDIVLDENSLFNEKTALNLIHSPKYQLMRWAKWFISGISWTAYDVLKRTAYKNNGNIRTNIVNYPDNYQEAITFDENVFFYQLNWDDHLFTGKMIDVTIEKVPFFVYFDLYNQWRKGGGNLDNARGYFKVNSVTGVKNIYPYGDSAFEYNRLTETLSIKGFEKGGS